MRLSFGVYVTAMNACQSVGTKRSLLEIIIEAVDPEHGYDFTDPNLVNWSKCENDFSPSDIEPTPKSNKFKNIQAPIAIIISTRNISPVVERFAETVCPLISNAQKRNLVAFYKYVIENDDKAKDEDIEQCLGKTKREFLKHNYDESDYAECFAGLFLYAMYFTKNKEGRGCTEDANCPVKKAQSNPGEKYDSKQQVKPEYADKVKDAINSCDKDCVLRITEEYIATFAKTEYSSESAQEERAESGDSQGAVGDESNNARSDSSGDNIFQGGTKNVIYGDYVAPGGVHVNGGDYVANGGIKVTGDYIAAGGIKRSNS